MWNIDVRSASRARRPSRRQLAVEALEARRLLTLNFTAAYEIGGLSIAAGGNQVAIDAQGNTYVAGQFSGVATFGNTQETAPSDGEAFVAKFSPTGTLDWFVPFANQASSAASGAYLNSLMIDAANQTVYLVGSFLGTVNFDPFPSQTGADVLTSSDGGLATDNFIVGLNESDGSVVNGNTNDPVLDDFVDTESDNTQLGVNAFPVDVTVDSTGDSIYVCGYYNSPSGNNLYFNPGSGNNFASLPNPPVDQDAGYIVKFTTNLAIDWVANATDPSGTTCSATDIASMPRTASTTSWEATTTRAMVSWRSWTTPTTATSSTPPFSRRRHPYPTARCSAMP